MEPQKTFTPPSIARRALRLTAKILGVLVLLVVLAYVGFGFYIKANKKEVLAKITAQLNENLDGTLTIGDMEPAFFAAFPRVSILLTDVHLRDRKFPEHHKEFLRAGKVEVAVNLLSLLRGAISIGKIGIYDADVYLLTDASGYSNTSVFKKKEKRSSGSGSFPELRKFTLTDVHFTADNRRRNKLFDYRIDALKGDVDLNILGSWDANITLKGFAESMSFNRDRGSFMFKKALDGKFAAHYDTNGKLTLDEQPLEIGEQKFLVSAHFFLDDPNGKFDIKIVNPKILWRDASHLLAENISKRLDLFNLSEPIWVSCDLVGSFASSDDPLILVNAKVRNNTLDTPGGRVRNCSFDGVFTNHFDRNKGFNDPNSAILLGNFTGEYGSVPFTMQQFAINDLEKPMARGDFRSRFTLDKLNGLIDRNLINFHGGSADVAVDFTADVVRFMLEKPKVKGKVTIENADVEYTQRGFRCDDVSVGLDFTDRDLFIRNITLNTGKSRVRMDGAINNFLNLYYDDPSKLVINWNVYSPEFHLAEFLGFFSQSRPKAKKHKTTGNFTTELSDLFEKSNLRLAMLIDKMHYKKFLAQDVRAMVSVTDDKIVLEKVALRNSSGKATISGLLQRTGKNNPYALDATVDNVDVKAFFQAFDNFGLESLKAENLSGRFSLDAKLTGRMHENGSLVSNAMSGNVGFMLRNGRLRNFDPIRNIGKFAFPHRNLDTITFRDLEGKFRLAGAKVYVEPMHISSSVLNMDLSGVYAFGKGTNMRVDVPLRDPGRDEGITDEAQLAKRRNRGIVLHLAAVDDDKSGKVKIKLTSGKDKTGQ